MIKILYDSSVGCPHLHINGPEIDSRIQHMVNLSLPPAVVIYSRKYTLDSKAATMPNKSDSDVQYYRVHFT